MKKEVVVVGLAASLAGCGSSGSVPPPLKETTMAASSTVVPAGSIDLTNYELTFSEEFDKPLDPNKWNDHIWYERSNSIKNYDVVGGELRIWPQRDQRGALVTRTFDTDRHFSQQYGYFEIEAKLPKGGGTLPAFWLLNHDGSARVGLDIMKSYTQVATSWPAFFSAALYSVAAWPGESGVVYTPDLTTDFHKYGMKWEVGKETFYFDGQEVGQLKAIINVPMYLLIDLWYQNPTPQIVTGSTNSLEVRYVHAYKMKVPTAGDPPPSCSSGNWVSPFVAPADTSVVTNRFGSPETKFFCASPISQEDIAKGCVCLG